MEFTIKINDLELRSCVEVGLSMSEKYNTAEIVLWKHYKDDNSDKKYCLTVAYWVKESDTYNLKFVGERPFEIDNKIFMKLIKIGQSLLSNK